MKMRRFHSLIVPLMFVLLAGVLITLKVISRGGETPSFDSRAFPFQLEDAIVTHITPKMPFFVADVDLDGNDDLLINEPTRLLRYRLHGEEMSLADSAAYERPGSTRMVTDANGDGRPEFFVSTWTAEGSMLSCHDWFSPKGPSAPLYSIGPLLTDGMYRDSPWKPIKFFGGFSTGNGAHPTIFIGLNTKKTESPCRSLLAFDGATGRELWRFNFGPHSKELAWDDSGADAPRVLLTTHSVATKISCGGMTDTLSYIVCLDSRSGGLLWKNRVTGLAGRSSLALVDLGSDGRNEILVARCLALRDASRLDNSAPWTVEALSPKGAVLDAVPLGIGAFSIRAVDLDGGPSPEILIEGSEGDLVILAADFAVMKFIKAPRPASSEPRGSLIIGVKDLADDGRPEIVCRLDGMLIVRDHEGTPIAMRGFAFEAQAELLRYEGRNYIVAARDDSIHVMTLVRTPLATRIRGHASHLTIAEIVVAVFLAGVGGFHFRRYLKRRREKHITFDEAQNDLLTAMAAYGHGGSSLRIVDRIRLHLKNWDRVQSGAAAREELFAKLHATFMETIVPELKHIAMLAHKARVPEEAWGTIISRARLAGQAMEAILTRGPEEPAADREGHIAEALMTLGDVDESLARIRSHLRSVFRTPVAEALERVVARFRDERGDTKVSLALPSGSSSAEGVFLSPVAFDKILEGLLANSARATEGRTDAEIVIEARWEGNYCTIDVRDNGCGIPREDWKRVFDRSYTTKEEGGFGLYYAHETLARFNGKIFVIDSVACSGTTMRAVLRKS